VRKLLVTAVAASAAALVGAAAGVSTPAPRLEPPSRAEFAYAGPIRDSTVTTRAPQASAFWGGPYTASTGETVTIFASTAYPVDDTVAQRWAEFVASLLHGAELTAVRVYLIPPREIRGTCGFTALACYDSSRGALYAPGQDVDGDPPAESIVAHEYGHHVAANRLNSPWRAVDYGTKRWGTAMRICPRTTSGELSPGNESDAYMRNPGEGFAEAYRVLNERRLGRVETPWEIVGQLLYPTPEALIALEQDVLDPWSGAVVLRLRGTGRVRTINVATPLDGTVRATLRGKGKVEILRPSGARMAGGSPTAATPACGLRAVRLRVTRPAGATGAFELTVTRP
jgi:hypothetical protein